jgi:hypothetical protein
MLFAMLASRAMALARLERFEEAADWATKAAARPNAHAHIQAMAAYCLALSGKPEEGRARMAVLRASLPAYGVADFLGAFQFAPQMQAHFRKGASLVEPGGRQSPRNPEKV